MNVLWCFWSYYIESQSESPWKSHVHFLVFALGANICHLFDWVVFFSCIRQKKHKTWILCCFNRRIYSESHMPYIYPWVCTDGFIPKFPAATGSTGQVSGWKYTLSALPQDGSRVGRFPSATDIPQVTRNPIGPYDLRRGRPWFCLVYTQK